MNPHVAEAVAKVPGCVMVARHVAPAANAGNPLSDSCIAETLNPLTLNLLDVNPNPITSNPELVT